MEAKKVIKINPELEVERLKERLSLMEEIIDYSVAETVQGLKEKNKELETEAVTLRTKDAEKDKLIAEKDKLISEIKNNFNNTLNYRLSEQRRMFEEEKKESLSNQRKNINSKIIKPKEELVEQAKEEVDRIQNMYNSLLAEFNQSHENELAIMNMCSEILSTVKQLVVSGSTSEEIVEKIDKGVESLQKFSIKEECEIIHNMIEHNHTKKEIAAYLYPDLARREQKVQDRINSKTYQEMYTIHP